MERNYFTQYKRKQNLQENKLRRKEEERFGKGKEPWADKSEDHNLRAEIWNLCKLVWSSYIRMWGFQKSSQFLSPFRNQPKGASENIGDIYYIHFKMRSLNSDFTKAKDYLCLFVDVAIKVEKS